MVLSVLGYVLFSLVWGVAISGVTSSLKRVFVHLRLSPRRLSQSPLRSACVVKA